jgi:hypothetical protein
VIVAAALGEPIFHAFVTQGDQIADIAAIPRT